MRDTNNGEESSWKKNTIMVHFESILGNVCPFFSVVNRTLQQNNYKKKDLKKNQRILSALHSNKIYSRL